MDKSLGGLSLVIPCFNEELAIQSVLRRCIEAKEVLLREGHFQSVEITVVDDASTDLSAFIIKSFKEVKLLSHPRRLGYGAALKTGFLASESQWLAMIDMDATYDPMSLLQAVPILQKDQHHLVLGDRLSRISGMPWTRKIGNKFFVTLIRLLHGRRVFDSCTGFRIFPKSWIEDSLRKMPDDLNFSLALTLLMLQQKDRFTEIPIPYATRKGHSKLNIVFHGFEFLWTILRTSHFTRRLSSLKTFEETGIVPAK